MAEYKINSQFTLLERAKGTINGREMLPLLDVLDKMGVDGFLRDWPFFPANMGIIHVHRRTASRPTPTRRVAYSGASASAMTTQRVEEPVVEFEEWSIIDEQEAVGLSDFNAERARRDQLAALGVLENIVNAIFNDARTSGDTYINGLKARLGTLSYPGHSTTTLPYVWDNGSTDTGYLTSAYIVELGPEAVFGLYPSDNASKPGVMGINIENKGLKTVQTAVSPIALYDAYQTKIVQWFGIATRDDRKFCRIANIGTRSATDTKTIDENVIIRALRHGRFNIGNTRIYVNPFLAADLDIRAKNMVNGWSVKQVFGEDVTTFKNIPVRVLEDTIIPATETTVS